MGKSAREGRNVVVTLRGADAAIGNGQSFFSRDGLSGGTGANSRDRPNDVDLYWKVLHLFEKGLIDPDVDR